MNASLEDLLFHPFFILHKHCVDSVMLLQIIKHNFYVYSVIRKNIFYNGAQNT